jgi:hypothetical protein
VHGAFQSPGPGPYVASLERSEHNNKRLELDGAGQELHRICEATECDHSTVREQKWELNEERHRLVNCALEQDLCLPKVLKDARRIVSLTRP